MSKSYLELCRTVWGINCGYFLVRARVDSLDYFSGEKYDLLLIFWFALFRILLSIVQFSGV